MRFIKLILNIIRNVNNLNFSFKLLMKKTKELKKKY